MANRQVTLDVSDNIIAAAVMAQDFWALKNLRIIEPHAAGDNTCVVVNPGANYIPINIGAHWFLMDSAVEVDSVTDLDTGALAAGADYYVYACTDGTTLSFKISANSTNPTGFDASHSRKIGGFHTLCVAVAHNTALTAWAVDTVMAVGASGRAVAADGYMYRVVAIAGDFKTHAATEPNWAGIAVGATIVDDQVTWIKEQHSLEGFAAKDILPQSVWCLKHRAKNLVNVGLVYNPGNNRWEYIYMAHDDGAGGVTSEYAAATLDSIDWNTFVDRGGKVGVQLFTDAQFQIAATGSNEETNISTGGDPATTGGHSDTSARRMISNLGHEDMCGAWYQWLQDQSAKYDDAVAAGHYDLPGYKGSLYRPVDTNDVKLVAGGYWSHATDAGSRSRFAVYYRWYTNTVLGARFVSEPL